MLRRTAALGVALLVAACATSAPTVNTALDPAADFSRVRTYSWITKPEAATPLMQQRIVDGVDARLQAAGWKPAPSGDVHVAAYVSSREKLNPNAYYAQVGYTGWGGFGPPAPNSAAASDTVEIGTLVVDVFNGANKRSMWRGTASGTLQSDPARMDAVLQAALEKMFAKFPPSSK